MSKLLSALIAATFAAVSFSAVAADAAPASAKVEAAAPAKTEAAAPVAKKHHHKKHAKKAKTVEASAPAAK